MKVSVVISLCDNRFDMFKRSLDTWNKQTLPKSDFELVTVDDSIRNDLLKLCQSYSQATGLQFKFIRIDNSRCDKPVRTFIPILSNNIGFRFSSGSVVVVTGPETLQAENNLKVASSFSDRKECGYGLVFRSNVGFVRNISNNWRNLNLPLNDILNINGATADCRTIPPHPPAYWYFMAVAKKYVENIGGVDEEFAAGFCAEDDDFANRMRMSGIIPVFEHKIVGIHQDHSEEDNIDMIHSIRNTPEGTKMRHRNIELMKQNLLNRRIVANNDHIWGDKKVVTLYKEF
ncbi:MAG: hypothetical protein ACXACY_22025 [Candidatus Hodarchaeales archaeon]|jgi:hypothetical protein